MGLFSCIKCLIVAMVMVIKFTMATFVVLLVSLAMEDLTDNKVKFSLPVFALVVVQVSRALYNYLTDHTGKSAQIVSVPEETNTSTVRIMCYNVSKWNIELHNRMEALGNLIQQYYPDVICFQEITPEIYGIFEQSNWWGAYRCSVLYEMVKTQQSFCMQLSNLPVNSFSFIPLNSSPVERKVFMAKIEILPGFGGDIHKPLVIATSHLQFPMPPDKMFSRERVAQAKEALSHLKDSPNVIFCGDMNWNDELDGNFPLFDGWIDAWTKLRPGENGWTYDTMSNPMLSQNLLPVQKRLDRFVCSLSDFKLKRIKMIGIRAIPGLSFFKNRMLPVLPSDHYGLLLEIESQ